MINRIDFERLTKQLTQRRRFANENEMRQIVEYLSSCPFSSEVIEVSVSEQQLVYQSRVLGQRCQSLFYHLAKRVVRDRQWAEGTTEIEYVDSLHQAIQHPLARVGLYMLGRVRFTIVISPTEDAIPSERLGPLWQPYFVVIYSSRQGAIVTGYQTDLPEPARLPLDVLWLL